MDFDKWFEVARILRRHGDELQSEIAAAIAGSERIQELRTMKYADYLETPEWQIIKSNKLEDANYHCELCNVNATEKLHVHHKTYEHRGHEQFSDLIVLCETCHAKFHDLLKDSEPVGKRRALRALDV